MYPKFAVIFSIFSIVAIASPSTTDSVTTLPAMTKFRAKGSMTLEVGKATGIWDSKVANKIFSDYQAGGFLFCSLSYSEIKTPVDLPADTEFRMTKARAQRWGDEFKFAFE